MFDDFKKNYDLVAVKSMTELSMMCINPDCISEKLGNLSDTFRDCLSFDITKINNSDLLLEYIIGTYYLADVAKRAKIEETRTILKEMAEKEDK